MNKPLGLEMKLLSIGTLLGNMEAGLIYRGVWGKSEDESSGDGCILL